MRRTFFIWAFSFFTLVFFSQEPNEVITICWDTSLSMQNRDLEKDFSVLEKVFERNPNQEVELFLFGIDIVEKNFKVENGDWSLLKKELSNVDYDGATVYANINERIVSKTVFLFTDGRRLSDNEVLILEKGSLIVNSCLERDEDFLKRTMLINGARLMDFASILEASKPKNPGKEASNAVSGTLFIDNTPAANVLVGVKGTDSIYYTDKQGKFKIPALLNDSLYIKNKDGISYAIKDLDNNRIFLKSQVTQLDEVTLIEERRETLKAKTTAYGQIDNNRIGVAIQSIGDEEITAINTDVSNVVQGRFSGVEIQNTGQGANLSQVTMRSQNSMLLNNYGLVVIDGVPQQQSSSASGFSGGQANFNFVDPENIADITVLKGFAATNRFGTLGANGVILITTKLNAEVDVDGKPVDRARLKNNVYDGEEEFSKLEDSPFYKAFMNTESTSDAYKSYISLRELNKSNINFYLDAFAFFSKNDKKLAARVISNLWEQSPNDLKILKTTELCLSQLGDYKNANRVNNQILDIENGNLQANYKKAMLSSHKSEQSKLKALLALHNASQGYQNLNTRLISKTLDRDIKNHVFVKGGQLNLTGVDPKYSSNVRYDARFVFEWNNSAAEFELQFVNPQNRFFNWEHTNAAKANRIREGMENGFMMEEFEFYGEEAKGKWVLNAKFLGNLDKSDNTPFVLKCYLYTNFGKPGQEVEEILVYFSKPNAKKNLKRLIIN